MSLYNLVNGYSPACLFILPMLGHHPDAYPRFRNCFTGDEEHPEHKDHIIVYTRTGGGNRDSYEEENEWIRGIEGFVTDYDDDFDCTFASWVFAVPDKWKADYNLIKEGRIREISEEYKAELYRVFPKLKDKLTEAFSESPAAEEQAV